MGQTLAGIVAGICGLSWWPLHSRMQAHHVRPRHTSPRHPGISRLLARLEDGRVRGIYCYKRRTWNHEAMASFPLTQHGQASQLMICCRCGGGSECQERAAGASSESEYGQCRGTATGSGDWTVECRQDSANAKIYGACKSVRVLLAIEGIGQSATTECASTWPSVKSRRNSRFETKLA